MSAATATADPFALDVHAHEKMCRFGMMTFLASEAMLFSGLIATYVILRLTQSTDWVPEGHEHLPWLMTTGNTVLLLASSVTFHFSEEGLKHGKKYLAWLAATIALGAAFVIIQGFEWAHMAHAGAWFDTGLNYTSCFFVLTGFHGFHVAVGVLLLMVVFVRSLLGHFTPERHAFFGNVGLYWHFVDVVWILLFIIVYFDQPWEWLAALTRLIMGA